MSDPLAEALYESMGEHGAQFVEGGRSICSCGADMGADSKNVWVEQEMHNLHLAEALAKAAREHIAAGWRPPARKIETVEELEALADETVIRNQFGDVFQTFPDAGGMLFWLGDETFLKSSVRLPAIVLWEPGDGDE